MAIVRGYGLLSSNYDWWRPYLDEIQSVFVVVELTKLSHKQPSTLTALIDQLGSEYCIDPRRVHAMGSSSSARFVSALACEASDRIASFHAAIGVFAPDCTPERPVPLLALTGDPDRRFVSESVEGWAAINGCDAEPLAEGIGAGVTRKSYQGCEADILFCDIEGAGHGFIRHECVEPLGAPCFENEVFDQLDEAERFFAEHPLPDK